uniref:Major capsid protein n=1 Tax=Spot-less plunderfish iridovirus TaxID=3138846 RepID=A0AAU7LKL9_9VIRU
MSEYQYSITNSYTYFVREIRKCTPFTQVPVVLSNSHGQPGFGNEWGLSISRQGDYLLHSWLRVTFPEVVLLDTNPHGEHGRIRWTRNLMHNLIKDVTISFSEIQTQRLNNYYLDFWAAFTCAAGKRAGYDSMIGNVDDLIAPHPPGEPLKEKTLNLPLPFFFTRDTGLALPTAALPYNDIKYYFTFRNWQELLILETNDPIPNARNGGTPQVGASISIAPVLTNVNAWCNYAIISAPERIHMGSCARDILIEQGQLNPPQTYEPVNNPNKCYDLRFSHGIKAIFFGIRNSTYNNVWSNYTSASPVINDRQIMFEPAGAADPISAVDLRYDSAMRFSNLGSDYFSHINPWYHAPSIPEPIGYHMYSYALDLMSVDPMGSTNFGRLNNVGFVPHASDAARVGSNGTGPIGSGMDFPQIYNFICFAINTNILTIVGGVVGFPVM